MTEELGTKYGVDTSVMDIRDAAPRSHIGGGLVREDIELGERPPSKLDDPKTQRSLARLRAQNEQYRRRWLVVSDLSNRRLREREQLQRVTSEVERFERAKTFAPSRLASDHIERNLRDLRTDCNRMRDELALLETKLAAASEPFRDLGELVDRCRKHLLGLGLAESDVPQVSIGHPPAERSSTVATIR